MKLNLRFQCMILIMLVLLFNACEEADPKDIESKRGDLTGSSLIHEFSSSEIDQIFQGAGLAFPASGTTSVRAVKINYLSPNLDGELRTLSGAIIFPNDALEHSLLSIQHGTVTKRTAVASVNPMNSSAGISALVTASQGYVTLVPDFAGFGDSEEMHPYLHAESLSNSVIDMIRASKDYCAENGITLDESLFLTGYSEGGYATLATQRTIEAELSDEFSLTASAPMAGPYDLDATAKYVLATESYIYPAYVGFMFTAYNEIYGFDNLGSVLISPYDQQLSNFYNGSLSFLEINAQLPQNTSDLINSSFRESYLDGSEQDYRSAFHENSLLDWAPTTPTRLYHGVADLTVPYSIAERTLENLNDNGATDLELVGIPDANHSTAGVPALISALEWFSTF